MHVLTMGACTQRREGRAIILMRGSSLELERSSFDHMKNGVAREQAG
jgi:hypothetical protein